MSSYYVQRARPRTADLARREGFTGPIRSERQADKERDAWQDAGWCASVIPSTVETRRMVRAWQKAANARHGR